jgi:rRNA maturation endonuclease Nob1
MLIVLDTSAIIAGVQVDDKNEYLITKNVLLELENKNSLLKAELSIKSGQLKVVEPDKSSVLKIKKKVEELGEGDSLSDADIMTLALALEFKGKGKDVILATDDYGIQNIASALTINYASIATPLLPNGGLKRYWHGTMYALDAVRNMTKILFYVQYAGAG